jgi:hypothetical protein
MKNVAFMRISLKAKFSDFVRNTLISHPAYIGVRLLFLPEHNNTQKGHN